MTSGDFSSWVEWSSPTLDRPLVPAVERLARQIRSSAAELARAASVPFEELYRPIRAGLGFTLSDGERAERTAWCLVGEWLSAWAVGMHDGNATIAETHAWFWKGHTSVGRGNVEELGALKAPLASASEIRALLPYLLDPSSISTRRDVLRSNATQQQRQARKVSGAYYTPGDVALSMVKRAVGAGARALGPWLDPAHGSGVFLRAVLALQGQFADTRNHLYGVDIDPFAAEATSFVLTVEDILRGSSDDRPWQRWHHFRRNLVTGNSLFIDSGNIVAGEQGSGPLGATNPWRIQDAFPEIVHGRFARIVANPPYVALPAHPSNAMLFLLHPSTGPTARADISPMFVELCLNLLTSEGALAVVTPLSTVTSTRSPFPQLRSLLGEQPGRIDYLSFDRVPDALFGDDIKTRNAIVHVDRSASPEVTATPLHRWTSRRRADALESVPSVPISGLDGVPISIPKIGSHWERDLYRACSRPSSTISSWIVARTSKALASAPAVDRGRWSSTLALAPTAYNYLGVIRDPSQAVRDGHDSSNAAALLTFQSPRKASAAFALLSSRLAFWLWHVTGDGFHVSARLSSLVPAPQVDTLVDALAQCGDELWQRASTQPVISVNRGKTTVSYPAWPHTDLLSVIDGFVDTVIGEPVSKRLAAWHERLIVVDEDSDRVEKMKRKIT